MFAWICQVFTHGINEIVGKTVLQEIWLFSSIKLNLPKLLIVIGLTIDCHVQL